MEEGSLPSNQVLSIQIMMTLQVFFAFRLKCPCDQKSKFLIFFGFQNYVI